MIVIVIRQRPRRPVLPAVLAVVALLVGAASLAPDAGPRPTHPAAVPTTVAPIPAESCMGIDTTTGLPCAGT